MFDEMLKPSVATGFKCDKCKDTTFPIKAGDYVVLKEAYDGMRKNLEGIVKSNDGTKCTVVFSWTDYQLGKEVEKTADVTIDKLERINAASRQAYFPEAKLKKGNLVFMQFKRTAKDVST